MLGYFILVRIYVNDLFFVNVFPSFHICNIYFIIGQGDRTYCFYCGGMLQHWNNHDVPWAEHARWYPNCKYVSQVWENIVTDNVSVILYSLF